MLFDATPRCAWLSRRYRPWPVR